MKVKGREFNFIIIHNPVPSDFVMHSRKVSFYNQFTSLADVHSRFWFSHYHYLFTTQSEVVFWVFFLSRGYVNVSLWNKAYIRKERSREELSASPEN